MKEQQLERLISAVQLLAGMVAVGGFWLALIAARMPR